MTERRPAPVHRCASCSKGGRWQFVLTKAHGSLRLCDHCKTLARINNKLAKPGEGGAEDEGVQNP